MSNRVEIVRFVHLFSEERGYPPSYREIGLYLGIAVSTVAYHVENLVAEGFLSRAPGKMRTLRVVP